MLVRDVHVCTYELWYPALAVAVVGSESNAHAASFRLYKKGMNDDQYRRKWLAQVLNVESPIDPATGFLIQFCTAS